jgi:hypothetical protein
MTETMEEQYYAFAVSCASGRGNRKRKKEDEGRRSLKPLS